MLINKHLSNVCKILRLHQGLGGKNIFIKWGGVLWMWNRCVTTLYVPQVNTSLPHETKNPDVWLSKVFPSSSQCHCDPTLGCHYLTPDYTCTLSFCQSTHHPIAKVPFHKDSFMPAPFKKPILNWLWCQNQISTPLLSRTLIRHERNMTLTLVQVLWCLLTK